MPAEQDSRLICPSCAYDLSGLPGFDGETGAAPRCPECGAVWRPAEEYLGHPGPALILIAVPAVFIAVFFTSRGEIDGAACGAFVLLPICGVAAGLLASRRRSRWALLGSVAIGLMVTFTLFLATALLFRMLL